MVAALAFTGVAQCASASEVTCVPSKSPYTGTLCLPERLGRHPAIVLLGGSEGGDSVADIARAFAKEGFVATSVAYFDDANLPPTLLNVPIEPVATALSALRSRKDVNPRRVALFGFSRGGELALLAASHFAGFSSVVSVVGSPLGWADAVEGTEPAWTYQGKPVAFARMHLESVEASQIGNARMLAEPDIRQAYFALEKIGAPVLLVAAGRDELWNSAAMSQSARRYLLTRKRPVRVLLYPKVGHLFLLSSDAARHPATAGSSGGLIDEYTAAANDAWPKIFSFIDASVAR